MIKQHISRQEDWTITAFVIKSVEYLLREEKQNTKYENNTPIVLQVPINLNQRVNALSKTNYPSKSCLIRTAILTQILREQLAETKGKWTAPKGETDLTINLLHNRSIFI